MTANDTDFDDDVVEDGVDDDDGIDDDSEADDDFMRLLQRVAALPVVVPPRDRTGETIAHYRLEAVLGRGAMGEVWRAWDLRLERAVALKLVVDDGAVASDGALAEARHAAKIAHPRVAAVYDTGVVTSNNGEGVDEGLAYIVMALVDGEPVRAAIQRGPMAAADVFAVAIDVAEALEALHRAGVVHRDIKPDNIVVGRDRRACVVDFGVAAHDDADAKVDAGGDAGGDVAGTPAYMCRAQAEGHRAPRHDVYSWAITMAELALGAHPRAGATTLPALPALPEALHGVTGLAALIWRCAQEPRPDDGAPTDGAALLGALRALEERPKKRRAAMISVGAGIAVVAVALAVVVAVTPRLPPSQQSIPVVSRDLAGQARFRSAVDALYVGDFDGAVTPLVDVVRGAGTGTGTRTHDDVAWPALLLIMLEQHERAGLDAQNTLNTLANHKEASVRALAHLGRLRSVSSPQAVATSNSAEVDDDVDAAVAAYAALDDDAYFERALLAWAIPWQNSVDEKLARLRDVEAIDRTPALPAVVAVNALLRDSRTDDATAFAKAALEKWPGNGALTGVVVRQAIADGDLDDAAAGIKALLQASPTDVETQFMAFDLALRQGRCAEARATATRLITGPMAPQTIRKAGGLSAIALFSFGCLRDGTALFHDVVTNAGAESAPGTLTEVAVVLAILATGLERPDVARAVVADVGLDVDAIFGCDAEIPSSWPEHARRLVRAERAVGGCGADVDAAIDAVGGNGVSDDVRRSLWRARAHPADRARHHGDIRAQGTRCARASLYAELPCRVGVVVALAAGGNGISDDDVRLARELWPGPDADLAVVSAVFGGR